MHDLHLPEHVGMAQVLAFRRHVGVDLLDRGGPGFPDGLQYVEFGAGGFGGGGDLAGIARVRGKRGFDLENFF